LPLHRVAQGLPQPWGDLPGSPEGIVVAVRPAPDRKNPIEP